MGTRSGPVDRWRAVRDEIHADVCANGFDAELGSFVQSYGSKRLDASLLLIPLVGFLPAEDERVVGTIDAIGRTLAWDGLIRRYEADEENTEVDGLPPGEGVFLPCSFWYAADLALIGRDRRGAGAVHAPAGAAERPRPHLRGVRPGGRSHARQLPAGVHPPRPRRLRRTCSNAASRRGRL